MESLLETLIQCGEHFNESFVVADLREEDQPLVYVNDAFAKLTAYSKQDIVGKNCRFLQGEATNPQTREALKLSIKNRECCFYDLLNYKKNGTPFWNRLVLFPIGYTEDEPSFYVGIQINVFDGENALQYFKSKELNLATERKVKNPFARMIQAERALKYSGFSEASGLNTKELAQQIITEVRGISQFLKSV